MCLHCFDGTACGVQIGELAEGVIQSITPYGAFVDLGNGMSGLLHISQISHDRITNVGAILSEGDKLKVRIPMAAFVHQTSPQHSMVCTDLV